VEIWIFAIVIAFLSLDTTAAGQFMVSRPIVVGPLIGWLTGDPLLGLGVGALVELIWIGQLPVGNVLPLDATLLTGLAVVMADGFSDASGGTLPKEALYVFALSVSIPLAMLSSEAEQVVRRLHKAWVRRAQHWMQAGRFLLADAVNLGVLLELFLKAFAMAALSLWLLRSATPWFLHSPEGVINAFRYAHWFLMALGCAAALDQLVERRKLPILIGAAVLSAGMVLFLHVEVLYILLVALLAGFALCLRDLRAHQAGVPESPEAVSIPPRVPKAALLSAFLRSFFLQTAWNFEKGLNYGVAFVLAPVLRRLFPPEERARALVRHMEYFNTQPYVASFILGAILRMEAERAGLPPVRQKQKEEEISALKMGMMGPVAAVGDNLFWATIRPFCGILAVSLMYVEPFRGAWLPAVVPMLFLLVFNSAHLSVRMAGFVQGFRAGEQVVETVKRYGFQEAVNGVRNAAAILLGVILVCMNHEEIQKGLVLFSMKVAFFGGLLGLYTYFLHKRANVAFLFYSVIFIAFILAYWPDLSAWPTQPAGQP